MDSTYRYYVLFILIFIFLIASIWLIIYLRKSNNDGKRMDLLHHKSYILVWKTNFSGPIEQDGKFDYIRWSVPSTEPIECKEIGYYTNNKHNLRLKRSRRESGDYSLVIKTSDDPVTIEDVGGLRHYPNSTSRIISTASFLTGFFIVKVRIPYKSNGYWPYIRLIAPESHDQNITNLSPCDCSGSSYYLFKPLYHCDESLYWTVDGETCVDGECENEISDKELVVDSYKTISIGLKWTRHHLKWYLKPKMGLNGCPSGKVIHKQKLSHHLINDKTAKHSPPKTQPRYLEFGIAIGGDQFNCDETPTNNVNEKMTIEEIEVYQKNV
jgi:hypothetical protein